MHHFKKSHQIYNIRWKFVHKTATVCCKPPKPFHDTWWNSVPDGQTERKTECFHRTLVNQVAAEVHVCGCTCTSKQTGTPHTPTLIHITVLA